MTCMKCGIQIPDNQVFCDHCLSVMEHYPIKPGIHIHLPKRDQEQEVPKRPVKKRRVLTPEEQLSSLRMKVLRLRLLVVILVFVICVVTGFLGLKLYEEYTTPQTGRNYTIDVTMND